MNLSFFLNFVNNSKKMTHKEPPVKQISHTSHASSRNAQGIEAEIPEALPAVKLRNWSGKPGPSPEAGDAPCCELFPPPCKGQSPLIGLGFAPAPGGGFGFSGVVNDFGGGGVLLDGRYAFEGRLFVGVRFA
jgi:hypothetical protein